MALFIVNLPEHKSALNGWCIPSRASQNKLSQWGIPFPSGRREGGEVLGEWERLLTPYCVVGLRLGPADRADTLASVLNTPTTPPRHHLNTWNWVSCFLTHQSERNLFCCINMIRKHSKQTLMNLNEPTTLQALFNCICQVCWFGLWEVVHEPQSMLAACRETAYIPPCDMFRQSPLSAPQPAGTRELKSCTSLFKISLFLCGSALSPKHLNNTLGCPASCLVCTLKKMS